MANQDLTNSLETLFGKMENFITTKTVVGQPTEIGGVVIVPLVDVIFGVGAGGGEKEKQGGNVGGLGAKMTPSAVLVILNDGTVQMVNVKGQDSISKLIDMAPGVLSKLHLDSIFGKKKSEESATTIVMEKTETENPTDGIKVEETVITETSS